MKKIQPLFLLPMLVLTGRMKAQHLEITPFTGFETSGRGYGITSICLMVQGDFAGGLFIVID
jgi:hypothetical protein